MEKRLVSAAATVGSRLACPAPFAIAAASLGMMISTASIAAPRMSDTYAESVNVAGISADGAHEVNIRLALRPGAGTGSIWAHVAVSEEPLSVVDETIVPARRVAVDTEGGVVRYEGTGSSRAFFRRDAGHVGTMTATLMMAPTLHPEAGAGSVQVSVSATFRPDGKGAQVARGRLEAMGTVNVVLVVEGREVQLTMPGKWHEQVGERPRFAPAFTYFNVQGDGFGLLAIGFPPRAGREGRVNGYLLRDGQAQPLEAFTVDPPGGERRFRVATQAGHTVTGVAEVIRTWSVPIEGQRRYGSTVRVASDLGDALGALNDWDPEG